MPILLEDPRLGRRSDRRARPARRRLRAHAGRGRRGASAASAAASLPVISLLADPDLARTPSATLRLGPARRRCPDWRRCPRSPRRRALPRLRRRCGGAAAAAIVRPRGLAVRRTRACRARISSAPLARRQAALEQQLLRLVDRDARDAGLLVHPAVALAALLSPRVLADTGSRQSSARRSSKYGEPSAPAACWPRGIASGDSCGSLRRRLVSRTRNRPPHQPRP